MPFLRINPREAVLAKGRTSWATQFAASNSCRDFTTGGPRVTEDYEIDILELRYRYGLGDGMDLSAELPLMSRGAGFLDPFITWWHRTAVAYRSPFRDMSPLGRSILDLPGHGRYGGASGIGDLTLAISKQISPDLLATISVKAPTGDSRKLLGSGAVDAGAALQWHAKLNSRWDFHAQGGFVYQGRSSELPEARRTVWQAAGTIVYRHNSKDTFIGQWQGEPSALVTGNSVSDDIHTMVTLGYRRKWDENRYWEGFMSEDGDWLGYKYKFFNNVAPDLTFGVRYIQRF